MKVSRLVIATTLCVGLAPLHLTDAQSQTRGSEDGGGAPSELGSEAPRSYLDEIVARALALLDGRGRNPGRAARLLQEAVDAGDARASAVLARLYITGDGVEADVKRAKKLLETATANSAALDGWIALAEFYGAEGPDPDPDSERTALERAAELGDQRSMIKLAKMLAVEADFDRLESLLSEAGKIRGEASAEAWRRLGDLYYGADKPHRDRKKAADAYQRAVLHNDASSMISLGRMFSVGDGVSPDFDSARDLLERGIVISQDDDDRMRALVALGDLYRNADRTRRDPVKAANAYEQAADLGDAGAMFALARMLSDGDGIPVDVSRASSLLEVAAQAGGDDAGDAWYALGELHREAESPYRDLVKAAEAYQAAADLGHQWAMIRLARMIASHEVSPYDFERARDLFQSAASLGGGSAPRAWEDLGDLYRGADEPWRDPARAAEAYGRAAELGDIEAIFDLARMVGRGQGVPVEFERARELLSTAIAIPGDHIGKAWSELGDLYRNADAPNRDLSKAAKAYEFAAKSGYQWANVLLARMILAGEDGPVDLNRVKSLLETAAGGGGSAAGAAWEHLGDLYRSNEPSWGNPEAALSYYELAATAGRGRAHLAAAEIKSEKIRSPKDSAELVQHYRAAVNSVSAKDVAKSMLTLKSSLLYAVVQQLLIDAGYSVGLVDGVYGPRTRQSASAFCAAREIKNCDSEIITLGLLSGLIELKDG